MQDYTPQQLKQWIEQLNDPNTRTEELQRTAMTLAHIRQPEALRALEEFKESKRAGEVEWLECAIDECIYNLLSPENEREEQDYIRVELWQRYERELFDLEGRLDAARVRKQQLEVEKSFLENLLSRAPEGEERLAVMKRLSGMDRAIALADNDILNLELEIQGQTYLVEQIENAIESPLYRTYGKRYIGVNIHRDCEGWLEEDSGG